MKKFSEETVKVFTGLVNGQLLRLPGDKLTSAIKKLYESKQFSNVDVYLVKVDEQAIYLEFDVQELPQLNEVRINGVKKSKAKELIKEAELKARKMSQSAIQKLSQELQQKEQVLSQRVQFEQQCQTIKDHAFGQHHRQSDRDDANTARRQCHDSPGA